MRETRLKLHPITGLPIVPLGHRANGAPIWPILGGAEGDGKDDDQDATGSGAGSDNDDDDDEDDEDDESNDESGKDESDVSGLKSALERERAERKRLKKEARELRQKVEAGEKEKLGDLERAEKERDEAVKRAEETSAKLQEQLIANAFLSNKKYPWHNAATARKLLDMSDVEIDDDGDVEGMDAAIEKLAKEHPYLINKSSDASDDDNDKSGSSGAPVGSGTKSDKKAKDRAAMESKYPALKR